MARDDEDDFEFEEVEDDAEDNADDDTDDEDEADDDILDDEEDTLDDDEAEPEPPPPPKADDPEVVGTLESFNARLDLNEDGNVWRVILYEKGGCDEALQFVKQLPSVRELWVIHTKVTPDAVKELQEEMPQLTIYK